MKYIPIEFWILLGIGLFAFLLNAGLALSQDNKVDEYRGCVASAYQATTNGFDLEANLAECYGQSLPK